MSHVQPRWCGSGLRTSPAPRVRGIRRHKTVFLHTLIYALCWRMTLSPAHSPAAPAFSPDSNAAPPPPTPMRLNTDYRWTPDKALAFLGALAECGKVAVAARAVGMTRQSAYRLKARSALVAQAWPLALAAGRERRVLRGRVASWNNCGAQGDTSQGDPSQGHSSQGYRSQGAGPQGYTERAAW